MSVDSYKLAVVTDAPDLWGAEHTLVDLMSQASSHGFDAMIQSPAESPIHHHPRLRSSTQPLELPKHPALEAGGLRSASPGKVIQEIPAVFRGAAAIAEAIRDYDVVLSFRLWRNEEVVRAARKVGIPAAIDLHDTSGGRIGRALSRRSLRRANLIITPSMSIAIRSGVPLDNLAVIPRAMGFSIPPVKPKASDRLQVGIFGQLQPHKGHLLLIEAVERAAKRIPINLLIAGGGSRELIDAIDARISGGARHVRRVDAVPNVLDEMSSCHVIANVSAHEAFGRTVIEGLATGCLPLVTGGGPAEIVRTVGVGIVCSRSPDAIAAALVDCWEDRDRLERAVTDGPRVVAERYSLAKVAESYFAELRRLVSQG